MNEEIQVNQEEMRPCLFCGKLCKAFDFPINCDVCHGTGDEEYEEDYTNRYKIRTCWQCKGSGEIEWRDYYCNQSCADSAEDEARYEEFEN